MTDRELLELAAKAAGMDIERQPCGWAYDNEQPDIFHCPQCGGPADNGNDRCFPPNPYFCTKCMASYSYQLADQMIKAEGDKSG